MVRAADLIDSARRKFLQIAAMGPDSRQAKRFAKFGNRSAIAFPPTEIFGEEYIEVGSGTLIGPRVTLTAGLAPGHQLPHSPAVTIGDRCVIGAGMGIVGLAGIHIGDDVWTGHNVYITDVNHGYEDIEVPPGLQLSEPRTVYIRDGAWIGNGATIVAGAHVGKHAVIGAGSVVTGDIPDFSVAAGVPARVIRRYVPERGWVRAD